MHQYDINFIDAQRLQALCNRLNTTLFILDADMNIAHAIKNQCRDLRCLKVPNVPDDSDVVTGVNLDIQRLRGFERTVVTLRAQAQGIAQLASNHIITRTALTR